MAVHQKSQSRTVEVGDQGKVENHLPASGAAELFQLLPEPIVGLTGRKFPRKSHQIDIVVGLDFDVHCANVDTLGIRMSTLAPRADRALPGELRQVAGSVKEGWITPSTSLRGFTRVGCDEGEVAKPEEFAARATVAMKRGT